MLSERAPCEIAPCEIAPYEIVSNERAAYERGQSTRAQSTRAQSTREQADRGPTERVRIEAARQPNTDYRDFLRRAMHAPEQWVVQFNYCDALGNLSRRVVSPIRFLDRDRFLGLCLSREAPRQFYINRCRHWSMDDANDFVMPVPMQVLDN